MKKRGGKRNFFRILFGLFSLSGIMFAFQACYGTPQDFGLDVHVTGKVVSGTNQQGIPSIQVKVGENDNYVQTGPDGTFNFFIERLPSYTFSFNDIDGTENGSYQSRDTVVTVPSGSESLDLQIVLN